jgi:hypothetical protein
MEFDRYLKDQGIKHQLTIHHSPQQNSVTERLNRTLVEHAQAMLPGWNMPKILWAEALNYATWLKNRLPLCATPGKTPYELINKSKPNLVLAHEFSTLSGQPYYSKENTPLRSSQGKSKVNI